jgi:hypothetical protein
VEGVQRKLDLVLSKESTPTKDDGTTVDTTAIQFHSHEIPEEIVASFKVRASRSQFAVPNVDELYTQSVHCPVSPPCLIQNADELK